VTHFLFLGREIAVGAGDVGLTGDAFGDPDAGVLQGGDFARVVGEEADGGDAEVAEDGGGEFVVAEIGFKAEGLVSFYRVVTVILEFVGADFVDQADAAALFIFVDDEAAAFFGDEFEREFELGAAIAAEGMEDVTGKALGMNAHQGRVAGQVTHADGDRFFRAGAEAENAEMAESRGEIGLGGHDDGDSWNGQLEISL